MAKLQADWGLIQQLYMEGLPLKELEAKTGVKQGTIASRATRANWKGLAARTRLELQKPSDLVKAETESQDSLGSRSKASRDALAKALTRFSDKLESLSVPNGKAALKLAQDLEPLVRSCKTVFGWQDSTSQPAVRINVLSGATLSVGPSDPSASSAQPILEAEVVPESKASFSQGPVEPKAEG